MHTHEATADQGVPVLAIVGPTAVGKTAVAFGIARARGGEIISADSMAVYRGVDIGTAKPTPAEQSLVRFHLVDVAEPTVSFSAAQFRDRALQALADCRARGRLPIVTGGTGLYVRVLLSGYGLAGVPADPAVRARLQEEAGHGGSPALHERLRRLDPVTAARLHPNDAVRIIRALEVIAATGLPVSAYIDRERARRKVVPSVKVGLRMEMKELDHRIGARVDAMFASGLVGETAGLLASGIGADAPALRGLGYRETVAMLGGAMDLPQCVEMVKRHTRRYARRQMTWFRAEEGVRWLDVTGRDPTEVAEAVLDVYYADTRRTTEE